MQCARAYWSGTPLDSTHQRQPSRPPIRLSACVLLAGALCALALTALGCDRKGEAEPAENGVPVVIGPGHVAGERTLMGTTFAIQVVLDDEDAARDAIRAALDEVARVEARISSWQPESELSAVNREAGKGAVTIGEDLMRVLVEAKRVYRETKGGFDITFAACGGLWDYDAETIPEPLSITECLAKVGSDKLEIDRASSTARLAQEGMRAGLGAIGKGYGIDRAAEVLDARGIRNYVVEGGGDIRISGTKRGKPWTVGVAHPRKRGVLLATMRLEAGAVVTSGDYERGFERDGVRYHHILDPRTGVPAHGAVAVTIVARTAMEADALATGVFVQGPTEGLALVERLEGVEALVIDESMTIRTSSGFPRYEIVQPLRSDEGAL